MKEILTFFAGGYLVPAFMYMFLIYMEDRKKVGRSNFDSLLTALFTGLCWPATLKDIQFVD